MKDGEIAKVVNELRDIATQYPATQQLRERIANVIVPLLRDAAPVPQDGDERAHDAVTREQIESWAKLAGIDHFTEKGLERLGDFAIFARQAALASNKAAAVAARPTDDVLWDQTLTERDNYHEWADKLANAIAEHFGNPWSVALDTLENMVAPIAQAWRTTEPSVCVPMTEDPGVAALWREAGFDVIELFESMPVAAAVAAGEPITEESKMEGTFGCPICGKDSPHQHSGEEVARHRWAMASAADLSQAVRCAVQSLRGWADRWESERKDGVAMYRHYADVLERAHTTHPTPIASAEVAITQATVLEFIDQFEIVGDNNDSRDPTDEEKFVLREFVLQLFDDVPEQTEPRQHLNNDAVIAEFERYFIDDAGNQEHSLAGDIDGYFSSNTAEHWETWVTAYEWTRARAASAQPSRAEVLDKPAKVGGTRFGKGVKWSTVIGAAQRLYEYDVTPEKEAARIERARATIESIQRGDTGEKP
jgi:hypothetical protein